MDAITRDLDRHLKELQREAERSDNERTALRRAEDRKKAAELHTRKQEALKVVDEAAARAVSRISWREVGFPHRACKRRGPHGAFRCGFHRHTIALAKINDAEAPLLLGANGRIYRSGRSKIYIAELNKRNWPAEILHVAELLDAM